MWYISLGLYPVAGWLRVACRFLREGPKEHVGRILSVKSMLINKVIERVKLDGHVRGNWYVPAVKHGVVWCGVCKIAVSVALEVNGKIAETPLGLEKDDFNHMNVAELKVVLKGVNVAIERGLSQ